jgi:predicted CXXCH cytochrome family protein
MARVDRTDLRFWLAGSTLAVTLGLAAFLFSSCATVTRTFVAPPEIEGATFVGNQACADCHTNIVHQFPGSPHGRYYRDDLKWAASTGCESCHGPGSKHVAGGGGRKLIWNPGKDPAACLQCHLETDLEFSLPQHHPVREGRMNCVECHDPHQRDILKPAGGLAMARLNEACAGCHRDQARPFVYEHEAMREGCVACHHPHGSVNEKLLLERDANLCLKCHAQVQSSAGQVVIGKADHSFYLRRGTCWSSGCHTAVHGSNINPRMMY